MNKIQYQFLVNLILSAGFFNFTFKKWKEDIVEIVVLSVVITATIRLIKYYTSKSENVEESKSVKFSKVLVIVD